MTHIRITIYLTFYWTLTLFGQSGPPSDSRAPVAMVAGEPITEDQLRESLGPQLMQLLNQEYELKSKALESLIRHRVVEAEAKKRNISAEKLIEQEVDSKVAEPTDDEVEAYFFGQNGAGGRFEDVKEQYRKTLKQLKLVKARQTYADSLRPKIDVAVLLHRPTIDVAYDANRVRGNPKAPVTIVEFGDFQCPFCQKTEPTLQALLAKYEGRVKLAFLDFPLTNIHAQAEKAAEAARCAGQQGKFWDFHDRLFTEASKLDEAGLLGHARNLRLDEGAFRSCLENGKFKQAVEADRQEGIKAGVAGTPAYFINGVLLSGAQPQAEFEKIIDEALAHRESTLRGVGMSRLPDGESRWR